MGTVLAGSRVSLRLTELPFLANLKMSPFLILSLAVSACVARPQSPSLPTGLSFAQCINYPFCDQTNGFLEVPAAPGAAVKESNRPGFSAHAAAENAVLLSQGRIPAGVPAAHLAHFQAEQAVRLAAGF